MIGYLALCSFATALCGGRLEPQHPLPADEANVVTESAELDEADPGIAGNAIAPREDAATPAGTPAGSDLMCERSCEELHSLFQELQGLRVVVGNLIDGLQKVVRSQPGHQSPITVAA